MDETSTGSPILVEDRGAARWVYFNRPRVHNAQNVAMLRALESVLIETRRRRDIRVLVLAGKGPSFCSGHDLKEMAVNAEYAANAATAEGRFWQELDLFVGPVELLRTLPIPTLCVVHGRTLAAGLMFVAACDLAIARDDATFASRIIGALAVNDAEVPAFAWAIGERRAKQTLWLGEELNAQKALEYGLINWVVSGDQLEDRVNDVVDRLTAQPREALALSKLSFGFMAESQGRGLSSAYHYLAHQLSHQTTEARDALRDRLARAARGASVVTDVHRGVDALTSEDKKDK